MGPTQQVVKKSEDFKHTTQYHFDTRLIEVVTFLPSYFSASTQKIIYQINELTAQIPPHPLERYLVHTIDQRFSRYNVVNKAAVAAGKSPMEMLFVDEGRFEHKEWAELESKEKFLKTLVGLQHQYQIQVLIKQEFQKQQSQHPVKTGGIETLRKPLTVGQGKQIKMDKDLIMHLLYHYYLVIIKTYGNSGARHVFKFHDETGRQLCLMILHGYLNVEQLYELFYYMVYIDKHPKHISTKLAIINHLYHFQCLKTYYTINLEKRRLNVLETTSRMYLNELYMNSIKEAEDPEIKHSDDTLLPIKVFPISRVKDKPKA